MNYENMVRELRLAVKNKDYKKVDELIHDGVDVNAWSTITGYGGPSRTALWSAIFEARDEKMIKKLLDNGSRPSTDIAEVIALTNSLHTDHINRALIALKKSGHNEFVKTVVAKSQGSIAKPKAKL